MFQTYFISSRFFDVREFSLVESFMSPLLRCSSTEYYRLAFNIQNRRILSLSINKYKFSISFTCLFRLFTGEVRETFSFVPVNSCLFLISLSFFGLTDILLSYFCIVFVSALFRFSHVPWSHFSTPYVVNLIASVIWFLTLLPGCGKVQESTRRCPSDRVTTLFS